jgi:hypothetical protein
MTIPSPQASHASSSTAVSLKEELYMAITSITLGVMGTKEGIYKMELMEFALF